MNNKTKQNGRVGNKMNSLVRQVWCVCVDTNGAHEAECIYSIWDNKVDANAEAKRLNGGEISLGCYGGEAYVKEVGANKSRDEWIG